MASFLIQFWHRSVIVIAKDGQDGQDINWNGVGGAATRVC